MNQIVCRSRMIGLYCKQGLENSRRFSLIFIRLVFRRSRRHQRQRIEDRRFLILWIFLVDATHGFSIGLRASRVAALLPTVVENAQRLDVILFARCSRLQFACFLNLGGTASQFRRLWVGFPKLVVFRHRQAPMRHGAAGISCRGLAKCLRGFFVGEGMQESHAARERFLRFSGARYSKLDGSKRAARFVDPMLLRARNSATQKQ